MLLRFFICWVFGGVAVNMVAPHWLWAEQVVQAVVDRGSTGSDKKHFPERADKKYPYGADGAFPLPNGDQSHA